MASNLFDRAIIASDLHLGLKSNSSVHNTDCLAFCQWLCTVAKKESIKTLLFLGDFHHNRSTINLVTLDYSLQCLQLFNQTFDRVIMITGNHDQYFKDKRSVHSLKWADSISNIEIINDRHIEGDCAFVPWMVGDDHKTLKNINAKYMFGHFEIPYFLMNAQIAMPDTGEISIRDFKGVDQVFSGHFHIRQRDRNVTYVGNCFPHNFSDVDDTNRGITILNWGQEPQFIAWPNAPHYHVTLMTKILEDPNAHLRENGHVKIYLDIDINYEESTTLRESFLDTYKLRELSFIPVKQDQFAEDSTNTEIHFESVNDIVSEQLSNITSDFFDPKTLLDIYNNL